MVRYLWYQNADRTGLNHQLDNLTSLVKDALYLGRVPVLEPPHFDPRHNSGHPVTTDWSRYIDVDDIRACRLSIDGCWEPAGNRGEDRITVARVDMLDRELSRRPPAAIPYWEALRGAEDAVLIRRDMNGVEGGLWSSASLSPGELFRVSLFPSREVVEISLSIIGELGIYSALHVRRGDKLAKNPGLEHDTSLDNIRRVLAPVVPPSMPVYILSDEPDRAYFRGLAPRFDVRRFFEWPLLDCLVGSAAPDNFLLYQIEKEIFYAAAVQVYTFRREGRRYYLSEQEGWG